MNPPSSKYSKHFLSSYSTNKDDTFYALDPYFLIKLLNKTLFMSTKIRVRNDINLIS
jgi:hypothetical protein